MPSRGIKKSEQNKCTPAEIEHAVSDGENVTESKGGVSGSKWPARSAGNAVGASLYVSRKDDYVLSTRIPAPVVPLRGEWIVRSYSRWQISGGGWWRSAASDGSIVRK